MKQCSPASKKTEANPKKTKRGRPLAQVFLDPRTGEAISLGIGLRVLYYFVLGLTSMLTGELVLLRRRHSKKKQSLSSTESAEE